MLRLATRAAPPASGRGAMTEIELTVVDDGRASDPDPAVRPGMGFLGMRERVASLSGRLSFEAGQETGSVLRVVIPVVPVALCENAAQCPA
jgi:glucose-6-phosphate-specific signal transduction histidine kinase